MKKSFIVLFFLVLASFAGYASPSVKGGSTVDLQLFLRGHSFDKMEIQFWKEKGESIVVGKKLDSVRWLFQIPESVYESYRALRIYSPDPEVAYGQAFIQFRVRKGDGLTLGSQPFFDRNHPFIDARYLGKRESDVSDGCIVDLRDERISVTHSFLIDKPAEETRISLSLFDTGFCMFENDKNRTYDDQIGEYAKVIRQHPQSRALLQCVFDNNKKFRSKSDIKQLYLAFSDSIRQTYWGRRLKQCVDTTLLYEPVSLQNMATGKVEPILSKSAKYHLILFDSYYCNKNWDVLNLLYDLRISYKGKLEVIYIVGERASNYPYKNNVEEEDFYVDRSYDTGDKWFYFHEKYNMVGLSEKDLLVTPDGEAILLKLGLEEGRKKLDKLLRNSM